MDTPLMTASVLENSILKPKASTRATEADESLQPVQGIKNDVSHKTELHTVKNRLIDAKDIYKQDDTMNQA